MQDDIEDRNTRAGKMRQVGDTGADIEKTGMSDFLAYWQTLRQNGDVPRRSDVDPLGIEPMLSNAFIVERLAPGLARLRIAGAHLSDLMGMEVRGMPLSALFTTDCRDRLADELVQVFDGPATLQLSLRAPTIPGLRPLSGTMILLPLRSDLGDISRALGCLVTSGEIGPTPRRFSIARSEAAHVEFGASLANAAPQRAAGFAEDAAPFAPQHAAERPYLRLVRDQDPLD